ncbi:hypothetical protein BC827DRAFT_1154770 [Russula dissimulans]|nr:hypothetical protein BC827DRAFT_1154770 [Russula dissimulans]
MQQQQTRTSNPYRSDEHRRGQGYPEMDPPPYYGSSTLRRSDGDGLEYRAPYPQPGSFQPAGPYRDENLPPHAGRTVYPGNVGNSTRRTQTALSSRCPNCGVSSWQNTAAGQGNYTGQGASYPNVYPYSTTQTQPYPSSTRCSACGFTPTTYSQPLGTGQSSSNNPYRPEPYSGSFPGSYPGMDGRDSQRYPQRQRRASMGALNPGEAFNYQEPYPSTDAYGRRNQANFVNGNTYAGPSMGSSSVNGVTPRTGSEYHKSAKGHADSVNSTRRVRFSEYPTVM